MSDKTEPNTPQSDESKVHRYPEDSSSEAHQAENERKDREVAAISRTVQPKSDAPSRAGIQGSGSGADSAQHGHAGDLID